MSDKGRNPKNGQFAEGNEFWKARSSAGRKPKFKTPEQLWEACLEYFDWCESHPLYEQKAFCSQGVVITAKLPKMRAMTIWGLCNFLDITFETWSNWRKSRSDLSEIITRTEHIIKQQKFEGASAELLNANIIARDLGLKDSQTREHSGPDGGPMQHELDIEQRIKEYKDMIDD